ncbi:MAG: hypothetical protein ACXU9U_04660 [Parachlamydiaceae bacterium]
MIKEKKVAKTAKSDEEKILKPSKPSYVKIQTAEGWKRAMMKQKNKNARNFNL